MRKLLLIAFSFLLLSSSAFAQHIVPKKWTFIIYINGINNLQNFGIQNIKQMEKIGSTDDLNIVVQYGNLSKRNVFRSYITKSTNPNKITSPVLEDLGLVDMGDYRTLQDFVAFAVRNFPAEHYFIDVWDHGMGWNEGPLATSGKRKRDISYDEISKNQITTEQLGLVMAEAKKMIGHNVDIYGSDACLMAMPEVANEMSDSVDLYVGSEALEPGAGWDYNDILKNWTKKKDITAKEVANIIVESFFNSYSGGSNGFGAVTMSAFDLSKLPAFAAAMGDLSVDLQQLTPREKEQLMAIESDTLAFVSTASDDTNDYLDVKVMLNKLAAANMKGVNSGKVAKALAKLSDLVIANKANSTYKKAGGVAMWMPANYASFIEGGRSTRYHNLKFNQVAHWDLAIAATVPRE